MTDLGTNHAKRRRVDRERVRVTRACDTCKKKKLRCSGTQPCELCARSGQECEFTALYTRGRAPSIVPPHTQSAADPDVNLLTPARSEGGTRVANPEGDFHTISLRAAAPGETQRVADTDDQIYRSSGNSPDPIQTDRDGHYIGSSSGISFLSRALRKIQQDLKDPGLASFTFGDAPLSSFDPYFLILPPRKEAMVMIRRHFDFAFPTHRFLHLPTVETWWRQFYDDIENSRPPEPGSRQRTAVILMVLAQAKSYISSQDEVDVIPINSTAYFSAAEHHLNFDTEVIRLEGVQARLAQCFWLLTQSRVNHAWTLFGTVTNLALALGLHRFRHGQTSLLDQESRKRVFWSAYSLDNYLSAVLGRPRRFHEEDIDQQFPSFLDDNEITEPRPPISNKQSVMAAAVYHARLSRIISGILRDLYGIRRIVLAQRVRAVEQYDARLNTWRDEVGPFLDQLNIELMLVVYQRQHTVLNLAFSHAVILLHRPALLQYGNATTTYHAQLKISMDKCLQAASKIVSILRDLTRKGQMFQAFWFTQYYAFSALIVLYVEIIQSPNKISDVQKNLAVAQQGLKDLSACASRNSYAQRYVAVLSELDMEAVRITSRSSDHPEHAQRAASAAPSDAILTRAWVHDTGVQIDVNPADLPQNSDTIGHVDPLTTGIDFPSESFATIGLGELDLLFVNFDENIFDIEPVLETT